MSDPSQYQQWMMEQEALWEARCTRCGACCGSLEDPCENLRRNENNQYYCAVYERRFGVWHTISGKELRCVPIRQKLALGQSWPGDQHCGYKQ